MPKKTKKEKLLATYRKQLKILKERQSLPVDNKLPVQPTQITPAKIEKVKIEPTNFEVSAEDESIVKNFFIDYRKSLIFITLIIALEIGLYFARLIK